MVLWLVDVWYMDNQSWHIYCGTPCSWEGRGITQPRSFLAIPWLPEYIFPSMMLKLLLIYNVFIFAATARTEFLFPWFFLFLPSWRLFVRAKWNLHNGAESHTHSLARLLANYCITFPSNCKGNLMWTEERHFRISRHHEMPWRHMSFLLSLT